MTVQYTPLTACFFFMDTLFQPLGRLSSLLITTINLFFRGKDSAYITRIIEWSEHFIFSNWSSEASGMFSVVKKKG